MSTLLGRAGAGRKVGLSVLKADKWQNSQGLSVPPGTRMRSFLAMPWLLPPLEQCLVHPTQPRALLECSWVNWEHSLSRQAYINSLTSFIGRNWPIYISEQALFLPSSWFPSPPSPSLPQLWGVLEGFHVLGGYINSFDVNTWLHFQLNSPAKGSDWEAKGQKYLLVRLCWSTDRTTLQSNLQNQKWQMTAEQEPPYLPAPFACF